MKKTTNILIGLFTPIFFHFAMFLMLLWEYNEMYSMIQNAMLYILPSLPGVALAILLIRNTLREFFKSWGICFLTSVCLILIHIFFRVDLMIYTFLTGYEEFSPGGGLLMFVMSMSYIVSCFAGSIIAGIVTVFKQKRNNSMQNK